ncbi:MAG: L,D-transpeptidase family protein [Gammaproteobacteria bacterium]|nr:L,D-transpeptidase family protein [Gammaproteobacteria bacterium]
MNAAKSIALLHVSCALLLVLLSSPGQAMREYPLPPDDTDLVGEVFWVTTRHEDTLVQLAREHGLGAHELARANPDVDVWLPGEGTRIRLPISFLLPPGPREGIVVNLAEYRLYYFPPGEDRVLTAPVGIGRDAFRTPVLETRVTDRIEQPSWTPPRSVRESYASRGVELARVVPPGPDNPLGEYAIMLAKPGYLIHGTNQSYGVGARVSHGCLRLYPEDIERLVWEVPVGTPVRIIHAPYKVGWRGDELVLQAHRPLAEFEEDDLTETLRQQLSAHLERGRVDWDLAKETARAAKGLPVVIGQRAETVAAINK